MYSKKSSTLSKHLILLMLSWFLSYLFILCHGAVDSTVVSFRLLLYWITLCVYGDFDTLIWPDVDHTYEKTDSILWVIRRTTTKIEKCVSESGSARDRNRKGDSRWLPNPELLLHHPANSGHYLWLYETIQLKKPHGHIWIMSTCAKKDWQEYFK